MGNWLRSAAVMTTRDQWTKSKGPLGEDVITAIRKRFNIGWWSVQVRTYGHLDMAEAALKVIAKAFNGKPVLAMKPVRWVRGDAPEGSPFSGVPVSFPLANANWHGGRGGHVGYSPVLPAKGDLAMDQFRRTHALYEKYGMDYHASFAFGERSITNVNQLLFDRDNPAMMGRVDAMFRELVQDARAKNYGEYRTHIEYMDLVASTYDYGNGALRRLNEKVKDALDPNGIVAPGKSGIWPAAMRKERKA
jgi:4-cresol dehydrogenase (hydroxylating)